MPTFRGLKKEFHLNNHVSIEFWFCVNDINCCMEGSKKWVIDWANLMTVWLVKVGTNLSQEDVIALEDIGFQLWQWEALSPCHRLGKMSNLPIPQLHFCVSPNPNAHPTT